MKRYFTSNASSTMRKRVIGVLLTIALLVGLTMPAMAGSEDPGVPGGTDSTQTTTDSTVYC